MERISRRLGVGELLVSESDILDGVADSALWRPAGQIGTAT